MSNNPQPRRRVARGRIYQGEAHQRYVLERERRRTTFQINRLPVEVLIQVFIFCLDAQPQPRMDEAPMLLCRICSSWRQISLTPPSLWNRLAMDARTMHADPNGDLPLTWFSHSGSLPLSLSLHFPGFYRSRSYNPLGSTINALHPRNAPATLGRLQNLELAWDSDNIWIDNFTYLANIPGVNITRLALLTGYSHFSRLSEPMILPPLPNLQKFTIRTAFPFIPMFSSSIHIDFQPAFNTLPWTQLTHVEITGYSMHFSSWRTILGSCIQLQHGSFVISTYPDPSNIHGGNDLGMHLRIPLVKTVFPALTFLRVMFDTGGDWEILSHISLPSLRTLCIGSLNRRRQSTWRQKIFMDLGVHNTLETFILFNVGKMPDHELTSFLQDIPKLRTLVLDVKIQIRDFLKRLKGTSDNIKRSIPFVPALERLTLHDHAADLNKSSYLEMAKARWSPTHIRHTRPGRCLAHLCIYSRTYRDKDILEGISLSLKTLRAQGLCVKVGIKPFGYHIKQENDRLSV